MNILSIFLPILAVAATLFIVFKSFTSKWQKTSSSPYSLEEGSLDEALDDIEDVINYNTDDEWNED